MSQAKQGDTVKVHYTGKLDSGEVFDTTSNGDPIEFTLGEGRIIPGFENAVAGMAEGENKTVTVEPEEAYGPRQEDRMLEIPRNEMPEHIQPEVGQSLQIRHQNGESFVVAVSEVKEDTVTLDANHPLAGQSLTFEIELVEVA